MTRRRSIYALADAIEPRYRALVLTATFTGLRLGELRALTTSAQLMTARAIADALSELIAAPAPPPLAEVFRLPIVEAP